MSRNPHHAAPAQRPPPMPQVPPAVPVQAAAPWWNNLRRAWFIGTQDAPVLMDPQPPPPAGALGGPSSARVPPAVKVSS